MKKWIGRLSLLRFQQRTFVYILYAIVPLVLEIAAFKLYKVMSYWLEHTSVTDVSVGSRLVSYSPFVAAGAAILFLLFWAVRKYFPHANKVLLVCWTVLALAVVELLFHAATGKLHSTGSWFVWKMFELFRRDLLFLMIYVIVWAIALDLTPKKLTPIARLCMSLMTWCLMIISSIEFGYYLTTGSMGSGYLLEYLVEHFFQILFVVSSEVKGVKIFLIILPLLLLVSSWYMWRRSPSKESSVAVRYGWVLWIAAIALWKSPTIPMEPRYAWYIGSLYVGLLEDLVTDPYWKVYAQGKLSQQNDTTFTSDDPKLVETPRTKRLNVVVFVLESMRSKSVTPYDTSLSSTPFLLWLSHHSMMVDNMYTVIPQTSKALVSVICGVYPAITSTWVQSTAGKPIPTSLALLLKSHGYNTAFFSPAYLQFENDTQLLMNMRYDLVKGNGDYDTVGFARTNYFGFEDRIMMKPSLQWIDSCVQRREPFFLTYLTLTGHHNYKTPPNFDYVRYPRVTDPELNDYLNALHYVDDYIRDFFGELEKRKLLDSTIVVLVGDHGEAFGEHGMRQHLSLYYEEGLHVPAFIYSPSQFHTAGRITGMHQQIDILPTIVQMLGDTVTGTHLPGKSMVSAMDQNGKMYFSSSHEQEFMVLRQGVMKYIYFYRRYPMQAYNMQTDAQERINLAPQLSQSAQDSIEDDLFRWRRDVNRVYLRQGSKK